MSRTVLSTSKISGCVSAAVGAATFIGGKIYERMNDTYFSFTPATIFLDSFSYIKCASDTCTCAMYDILLNAILSL